MSSAYPEEACTSHPDSIALDKTEDYLSSLVGTSAREHPTCEHPSRSSVLQVSCNPKEQLALATATRLSFRITGSASVARLEPLLLAREWSGGRATWSPAIMSGSSVIDFVWETTVTKARREQHRNARVLNRLSGSQVLEDKANLARVQRLMAAPTLESYVVAGRTEVDRWAALHFRHDFVKPSVPLKGDGALPSQSGGDVGGDGGENWWCVKAAGGNGGMDVWVMHEGNWRVIVQRLHETEEYVIQRYVARPMLWRGKKFHFRCYATISADMSAWLYRMAYILCASRPYVLRAFDVVEGERRDVGLADDLVHISNLAVNKHTEGHPGQVPCDIPSEYSLLWPQMLELVRSLVVATTHFMAHQAGVGHFEFLGLDFIADETGRVWLIEVNRLPGLQSSKQNLEQENDMYDTMMVDLVRLLVLPSLIGCPPEPGLFEVATEPIPSAKVPSTETWRNILRFAAFKRACKRKPPAA